MPDNMYTEKKPILTIKGLKKYYPVRTGILGKAQVKAVDGVDLTIYRGETLGLVGESGCGKSTIGRQIVGLEKPTHGQIFFDGQNIAAFSQAQRSRKMQMIFQDSFSSLNPRRHVRDILAAPMLHHGLADTKNVDAKIDSLLDLVGLPRQAKQRYSHEFSGGQRQRIGIARALSLRPELLVCDEPVSALDVSIQAQILNLLRDLQKELGLTCLFIGHGLGAVRYVSDRIAVMYLGKIVEVAQAGSLFDSPAHPYTRALCDAVPVAEPSQRERERIVLAGDIPGNIAPPQGCRFHTRCLHETICSWQREPALLPVGSGHIAACHLAVGTAK